MQFADQTGGIDHKPTKRSAALIDSLFEAPGPLFAGIVFVAFAAGMTALKTGQTLLWACVLFLVVAGAIRVFDFGRFDPRKSDLTAEEAGKWQQRYRIGALIQAAAIGTWCATALL